MSLAEENKRLFYKVWKEDRSKEEEEKYLKKPFFFENKDHFYRECMYFEKIAQASEYKYFWKRKGNNNFFYNNIINFFGPFLDQKTSVK